MKLSVRHYTLTIYTHTTPAYNVSTTAMGSTKTITETLADTDLQTQIIPMTVTFSPEQEDKNNTVN